MTHKLFSFTSLFTILILLPTVLVPGVRTPSAAPPPSAHADTPPHTVVAHSPAAKADIDWGQMQVLFVENQGQLDDGVAYYVQGSDKTIYFASDGITFALTRPVQAGERRDRKGAVDPAIYPKTGNRESAVERWVVKLDFVDANPRARIYV
jgi:hypothetical protein